MLVMYYMGRLSFTRVNNLTIGRALARLDMADTLLGQPFTPKSIDNSQKSQI